MNIFRRRGRVAGTVWTALGLAAVLAVSSHWLQRWRLPSPERSADRVFRVTSSADSGPGSLREGIFAADRANGRARVTIDVPRIVLKTPLPPLVNPAGVVIDGEAAHAVLDASGLGDGPVLDLQAPASVIIGLRIERAPREAILIRKEGARLRNVSVADSDAGVYQADGAGDLVVEDSTFERNTVGVHAAADGATVKFHNNRFRDHRRAAIWAVAVRPPSASHRTGIDILRNQFSGDYQPLVLLNIPARIERNMFEGARAAALHVSGASVIVRNNRMRAGHGFGIDAVRLAHGIIADNELDHNCAGGMIVRNSHDTQVSFNRVYANGYGIILVHGTSVSPNTVAENLIAQQAEDGLYIIGGSPILRRNRLLQNRKAGLHLSSFATVDRRVLIPEPLLEANVVSGNGTDDVQRDEYAPQVPAMPVAEPADCAWRLNGDRVQIARLGGGS